MIKEIIANALGEINSPLFDAGHASAQPLSRQVLDELFQLSASHTWIGGWQVLRILQPYLSLQKYNEILLKLQALQEQSGDLELNGEPKRGFPTPLHRALDAKAANAAKRKRRPAQDRDEDYMSPPPSPRRPFNDDDDDMAV